MNYVVLDTTDPSKWQKAQVASWIEGVCKEFEIDEEDASKLKTLSGAGLVHLKRQDWLERSPNQGDLFFNLWTKLIEKGKEFSQETENTPPFSFQEGVLKMFL